MARVAAAVTVLAIGVFAGVDAPFSSSSEVATTSSADPETVTVEKLVDGKPVRWWANRARANGEKVRARGITLRRIRSSLHDQVRLGASGLERAFMCVHRFEGSWSDTGAPYYGGLQMDWTFMGQYGAAFLRAFGPASNWTPSMQLAVAERAYLEGRGWAPWPNTARMCGLR